MGVTAAAGASGTCGPDAVPAGTVCLDRYEATVWRVPNPTTTNALLVRKIQLGIAAVLDLTSGGATRLGIGGDNFAPCTDDGQSCAGDIYAVSLPSQIPSAHITWFQAQEACASSGKRLPTSAEWQVGANGTPDPGPDNRATDCNSASNIVSTTGSRGACVSARGAFDMAGNLEEWVADWAPLSSACTGWGGLSDDRMCLAGASTEVGGPGALTRGGSFVDGTGAGPLAVVAGRRPSSHSASSAFAVPPRVPGRFPRRWTTACACREAARTPCSRGTSPTARRPRGPPRTPAASCRSDRGRRRAVPGRKLRSRYAHWIPSFPPRGDGFWYLVRGENVLGDGPYGFEGLHGVPTTPRLSATCP